MRATSIAVDVAEGGAGLLTPGDRVDVILTQTFTDARLSESQRSVSETILPNLRIIAIDQTTHVPGMARPGAIQAPVTAEPRLPKTVTLEVSVHQAEMLTVAGQLRPVGLQLHRDLGHRVQARHYVAARLFDSIAGAGVVGHQRHCQLTDASPGVEPGRRDGAR